MSLGPISIKVKENPSIIVDAVSDGNKVAVRNTPQKLNKIKQQVNGIYFAAEQNSNISVESINYRNNISVKVNAQNAQKVSGINYQYQVVGAHYLRDLLDVNANSPSNKDSLIFNRDTNKFESKPITLENTFITNLDAGLF